jgi:ribonuclease Z
MKIRYWEHAGLKVEGLSLAGINTCLTLPQYSLAFDIGNGASYAFNMSTFLISHGHMDHAAGIPYIIAQKAMSSHRPPRFIMPESLVAPMEEIMRQWSLIEGHQYDFEFIGSRIGDEFPLKADLIIRSFPTVHRIPSLGYSLCRKFRKLKSELIESSTEEIIRMRKQGQDPTEERQELLVSYSGDTQIEFLDQAPEVSDSKILILETTYLDERNPIGSAKEWGHTHLDELIPRLGSIRSEKILLIHTSARYSLKEAQEELSKRLPQHERERVQLFMGR